MQNVADLHDTILVCTRPGAVKFFAKVFGYMNVIGVAIQIFFPSAPPCKWPILLPTLSALLLTIRHRYQGTNFAMVLRQLAMV